MNKRELKRECYLDILEDSVIGVESVLNHLEKIKSKQGIFDDAIIQKDLVRTYYDLELALASLCILLRKMAENVFIDMGDEMRKDINSIIHSNKFEYQSREQLYVYSQKGREDVSIARLLQFAKSIYKQ